MFSTFLIIIYMIWNNFYNITFSAISLLIIFYSIRILSSLASFNQQIQTTMPRQGEKEVNKNNLSLSLSLSLSLYIYIYNLVSAHDLIYN